MCHGLELHYLEGGSPLGHILVKVSLLPTGSEESEVLGVGSIPIAILPSGQNMKTIAL